jgi:hypothetical protein
MSANYTQRLKIILNTVVQKIHGASAVLTSETTVTGNFITHISGPNCSEYYRSSAIISESEAEADAIYRFLRYRTNILGYNIVDINYPTLANLVSDINKFNEEINEFLLCATKAANLIHQVHKDINKMYQDLIQQIPLAEIPELTTPVEDLLNCTQTYSIAADQGINAFRQSKVLTN